MMYNGGMDATTVGFRDELMKLATKPMTEAQKDLSLIKRREKPKSETLDRLRGKSSPRQRDYLASAAVSALTFPAMALIGAKMGRSFRNRETMKAISSASRMKRRKIRKRLETGSLISKSNFNKKPGQVSRDELAARAVSGGVVGSVIMALRDRMAGSTAL